MVDDNVVEVFELVAELAAKRGITEISDLVTIKIDETWTAKTNGHRSEVREGIPPFHMLLEFNGWPFGLIHPFDGTMAQHPNVNEDTLCAALKAAIEAEEAARA